MWLTKEMGELAGYLQIQESALDVGLGVSNSQLVARNGFRWAIEFALSGPPTTQGQVGDSSGRNFSTIGAGKDTSLGGVLIQRQMDPNKTGRLTAASVVFNTAGATLNLQLVRGANTLNLASFTANGSFIGFCELLANDTIQWNATVSSPGGSVDLMLCGQHDDQLGLSLSTNSNAGLRNGKHLIYGQAPILYNYRDHPQLAQSDWYATNLSQLVKQRVLVTELLFVPSGA